MKRAFVISLKAAFVFLMALLIALAAIVIIVQREFGQTKLRPRIEKAMSAVFQAPVTVQNVEWRWLPKPYFSASRIDVHRNVGPRLQISELRIKIDLHHILARKISIDEIEVFKPVIWLSMDQGRFLVPQESKSFFDVDLRALRITEGEVKFIDKNVGKFPNTRFYLDGTLEFSSSTTIHPLTVDAVIVHAGEKASVAVQGTVGSQVDIHFASKEAPLFSFSEIVPELTKFSGLVELKGDYSVRKTVALWGIQGTVSDINMNGQGNGMLEWKLTKNTFEADWTATDFDSLQLQEAFGIEPRLSGLLTTKGTLSGTRNPFDIRSTVGNFTVNIGTGVVYKAPGFLKFTSKLNLTSLLKKSQKSSKGEFPFEWIAAEIVVQDGKMIFKQPILFTAKTLQMAFTGNVDVPSQTIGSKVIVNFLDPATEVIKFIPGVRTILLGGRETLVPMFVSISGPLKDPKVDVESFDSISSSILETTKNVLKYPVGLIKSIFDRKDRKK